MTAVTLVDAVNVTLADARIAAVAPPPGGGRVVVPGVGLGWPVPAADRASYTLDWATEGDLQGALLGAGSEEAPILHLRVDDPTRDASFEAWRVVYEIDGDRRVSTFTHAFRMAATVGPCS